MVRTYAIKKNGATGAGNEILLSKYQARTFSKYWFYYHNNKLHQAANANNAIRADHMEMLKELFGDNPERRCQRTTAKRK